MASAQEIREDAASPCDADHAAEVTQQEQIAGTVPRAEADISSVPEEINGESVPPSLPDGSQAAEESVAGQISGSAWTSSMQMWSKQGDKMEPSADGSNEKDAIPGAVSSVSAIGQSLLRTGGDLLTRMRPGSQASSEPLPQHQAVEPAENTEESSESLKRSHPNTSTAPVKTSVQSMWAQRREALQKFQREGDRAARVSEDGESVEDQPQQVAQPTETSSTLQLSAISKSIYASGEQLLSSVQTWREKKDTSGVQEGAGLAGGEGTHGKEEDQISAKVDIPNTATLEVRAAGVRESLSSATEQLRGVMKSWTEKGAGDGQAPAKDDSETHSDEKSAAGSQLVKTCNDLEEKQKEDSMGAGEDHIPTVASRRGTAEEWEVVEEERVKCWRCGALVSPQMDSIEEHSLVCSRPSLPNLDAPSRSNTKESQEESSQPDVTADISQATDASATCADAGQVASEDAAGATAQASANPAPVQARSGGGLTLGPVLETSIVETETTSTKSFAISTAAISAVSRLKKLGLEAKDRAYQHYYSRGVNLPESGEANIQMAHTALFLSCDGVNTSVESAALGLRSEDVGEESTWVLLRLDTEGMYKVKSVMSGRCLVASAADEHGVQIRLSASENSPEAEWRISKSASGGSFHFQNAASGRYLAGKSSGVLDGTELEAVEVVSADCDWIVAAVTPLQDAGEEQTQQKSGLVDALTPDLDAYVLYSRVESTMERSILMVLDPVLHGIPSLGILSAKEDAKRFKAEHGGVEAAILALKAKIDVDEAPAGLSQKILMKASELLVIRFLPFVGGGAYLSFTLYTRLRLAALIAEIYGVDTEDAEVQSMLLFCIAPDGSAAAGPEGEHVVTVEATGGDQKHRQRGVRNVVVGSARILAHTLVRQVLKRATGWKTAADLYDLAAAVTAEGYTHVCGEGGVPEDGPQAVEGGQQATLRRATLLFKPSLNKTVQPFTLALLCVGAALPSLASASRQILKLVIPILGVQITVALLVCLMTSVGIAAGLKRYEILDYASEVAYDHPELISSVVCVAQAALPLKASFDATATIIDGCCRTLFTVGKSEEKGGGLLVLLLAFWLWFRILRQCLAEPNTPAAKGQPSHTQRMVVYTILAMGVFDILGSDGFAFHSWIRFGSLDSHHWLFGLLSAMALECQMRLIISLRDRDVLLRILGATRMMSLALVLFLGGLTASVGFLVSRKEFSCFVDSLAPPPQVMTVILTLRRKFHLDALLIGVGLGVLWHTPTLAVFAMPLRLLGTAVGAYATGKLALTFEEYREPLLDPNGGRWLLLFPESSEKATEQAMKVWAQFSREAADKVIAQGTQAVGKSVISRALDYAASYWSTAPLDQMATAAVEVVEKVEAH